jgi:hypothetical protein
MSEMGQSRPSHSTTGLTFVRCCPKSDHSKAWIWKVAKGQKETHAPQQTRREDSRRPIAHRSRVRTALTGWAIRLETAIQLSGHNCLVPGFAVIERAAREHSPCGLDPESGGN